MFSRKQMRVVMCRTRLPSCPSPCNPPAPLGKDGHKCAISNSSHQCHQTRFIRINRARRSADHFDQRLRPSPLAARVECKQPFGCAPRSIVERSVGLLGAGTAAAAAAAAVAGHRVGIACCSWMREPPSATDHITNSVC